MKRPLNLTEKLLANAAESDNSDIQPGKLLLINLDWVISSELSWAGMEKGKDL